MKLDSTAVNIRPTTEPKSADESAADAGDRTRRLVDLASLGIAVITGTLLVRKLSKARASEDKLAVAEVIVGMAGLAVKVAGRVRSLRGRRPKG